MSSDGRNVLDYAPRKTRLVIAWREVAVELLTVLAMIVAFLLIQILVLGLLAYLTSRFA